jgi:DNA polymerase-3 subunit epsilon
VENGRFYGMGYIDSEVIINDLSQIKEHIMPYKTNQYIMQLIFSFAQKYPRKVHLLKITSDLQQVLIPIKEM